MPIARFKDLSFIATYCSYELRTMKRNKKKKANILKRIEIFIIYRTCKCHVRTID